MLPCDVGIIGDPVEMQQCITCPRVLCCDRKHCWKESSHGLVWFESPTAGEYHFQCTSCQDRCKMPLSVTRQVFGDMVRLKIIKEGDDDYTTEPIDMDDSLREVLNSYADGINLHTQELTFTYGGAEFDPDQTPRSIQMRAGNIEEVTVTLSTPEDELPPPDDDDDNNRRGGGGDSNEGGNGGGHDDEDEDDDDDKFIGDGNSGQIEEETGEVGGDGGGSIHGASGSASEGGEDAMNGAANGGEGESSYFLHLCQHIFALSNIFVY